MSFERRKSRVGRVVGDKMDKTVIVAVEWAHPHRVYKKAVKRRSRFKAHDDENRCKLGDVVRVVETRPRSKTKRWRIAEILSRGDIAEIQPEDIAVGEGVVKAGTPASGGLVSEPRPAAEPEPAAEATGAEGETASEGPPEGKEEAVRQMPVAAVTEEVPAAEATEVTGQASEEEAPAGGGTAQGESAT